MFRQTSVKLNVLPPVRSAGRSAAGGASFRPKIGIREAGVGAPAAGGAVAGGGGGRNTGISAIQLPGGAGGRLVVRNLSIPASNRGAAARTVVSVFPVVVLARGCRLSRSASS